MNIREKLLGQVGYLNSLLTHAHLYSYGLHKELRYRGQYLLSKTLSGFRLMRVAGKGQTDVSMCGTYATEETLYNNVKMYTRGIEQGMHA